MKPKKGLFAPLMLILGLSLPLEAGTVLAEADPYEARRLEMVERQLRGRDITDGRVLAAMQKVPRHRFVPAALAPRAYADHPLPIGQNQTISQPYIVALMTQLAEVRPGQRVLEIGTGSGYQAAVLAELTDEVYTIEILPALAERAAERLKALGYGRVKVKAGDGYLGWPEAAPFDAVLITAAVDHIPPRLLEQLKTGGRMVLPLGRSEDIQTLSVVTKGRDGRAETQKNIPVVFVPMTGEAQKKP